MTRVTNMARFTATLTLIVCLGFLATSTHATRACTRRCANRAKQYGRRRKIHDDCLGDGRDGRPKEGRDVPRGWSHLCTAVAQGAIRDGCVKACGNPDVDCDKAHDDKYSY